MSPFEKFKKKHDLKNTEISMILNLSRAQITRKVQRDDWRLREMRAIEGYINKKENEAFNIVDIFNEESEVAK